MRWSNGAAFIVLGVAQAAEARKAQSTEEPSAVDRRSSMPATPAAKEAKANNDADTTSVLGTKVSWTMAMEIKLTQMITTDKAIFKQWNQRTRLWEKIAGDFLAAHPGMTARKVAERWSHIRAKCEKLAEKALISEEEHELVKLVEPFLLVPLCTLCSRMY